MNDETGERVKQDGGPALEIGLGKGDRHISTVHRGERVGVVLRKISPVEIGTILNREPITRQVDADDVIIWFDKIESARIFQDAVNKAILHMGDWLPYDKEAIIKARDA